MSEEPDFESFEIAGTRFTRQGRFMHVEAHRTPEQQQEMDAIRNRLEDEAEECIASATRELEVELSKYPSFDILSNLMIVEMAYDPETYKEWSHKGLQAHVEHATLLVLKGEFRAGGDRIVDGPNLEKIQGLLSEIFHAAVWHYTRNQADNRRIPDAAAKLRLRTIVYGLFERNAQYEHHRRSILNRLFGDASTSSWLKTNVGFTVEDALNLNRAATRLGQDRLNERCRAAREEAKALETAVRQLLQGKPIPESAPEEVVSRLEKLKDEEFSEALQDRAARSIFSSLGDAMTFTAVELAEAANVDITVTRTYLCARSMNFGSVDSQFSMPTATPPLIQRPFVHHEGRYLVTAPSYLDLGLKDYLEDQLKSSNFWARYSNHRSEFLERASLDLLGTALPNARVYRNLKYMVVEGELDKEVELDGLIFLDRVLFLVEAKAGTLTTPALRGAPERIRTDLRKLLGEAHSQALRARTYITETDGPTFKSGDREVVHVDLSEIDHILSVAVTLDPLANFPPVLHEVAQLGIFAPGELPWATSIYDLQVICEMLEFPSQLVHFLQRRGRLNALGRMEAADELDWFGHYLSEGLYFEENSPDLQVGLLSYTTEFDDYYLYEQGQRSTPAAKPRQPMPDYMRQLLAELEEEHPPGYLTGALILLDMSGESREEFARVVEMQRQRSRSDGKNHNVTLPFDDLSMGVTVFTTKRLSANALWDSLETHCHFKKYEFRADRWAGFGILADQPGNFHVYCADSTPWQPDAATSAALKGYKRRLRT